MQFDGKYPQFPLLHAKKILHIVLPICNNVNSTELEKNLNKHQPCELSYLS